MIPQLIPQRGLFFSWDLYYLLLLCWSFINLLLKFLKFSVGVTKCLLGCPQTFALGTPVVKQVSWLYREQRITKVAKTVHGHHLGWGGSDSWGWAPLPCPPVTNSWAHGQCGLWVSVGWLMGKFGGGSTAPLSCCFSSEEITTGKTKSVKKHRREREKGE